MNIVIIIINIIVNIIQLFSLGTYAFRIFQNETLFIADYENVPKFVFGWLAAKLWLKESTILWNDYTFE